MKKILVPTDFSEHAQRAIDFAAHLARKTSGELYLLHVIENEDDYSGVSTSGEWNSYLATETVEIPTMLALMKQTAARMHEIKQQPALQGLTVYDNVEVGTPGIHINAAAEKYKADMIIMGTHGSSALAKVVVGNNVEKVVHLANRPVLTIKEKFALEPKTIVIATDFSEEADAIFGPVSELAGIYNANIHLLIVNTKEKFESYLESEKKINDFREKHNINYPFTIYNDHSKEAGVLHFSKDINADLIAVGAHGHSGLARFFNQSISDKLVNHAFCPVLTVTFKNNS